MSKTPSCYRWPKAYHHLFGVSPQCKHAHPMLFEHATDKLGHLKLLCTVQYPVNHHS